MDTITRIDSMGTDTMVRLDPMAADTIVESIGLPATMDKSTMVMAGGMQGTVPHTSGVKPQMCSKTSTCRMR